MKMNSITPIYRAVILVGGAAICFGAASAHGASIIDPGQGPVVITGSGASELSGLTHLGGSQYYAVPDGVDSDPNDPAIVYPLTIVIDPATGMISGAPTINSPLTLRDGSGVALTNPDTEGIAYNPINNSVYVSDEGNLSAGPPVPPVITEHDLITGNQISTVTPPTVYTSTGVNGVRTNKSLESLSRNPANGDIWTANEEALRLDGGTSDFVDGTTVRIQRFDSSGTPTGQWAYETDSIGGDNPFDGDDSNELSGLVDIVALPGGTLLMLERATYYNSLLDAGFRTRIYEVDPATGTDVSAIDSLNGASYTAVTKTLLAQGFFTALSPNNYEGIALGPQLNNGNHSLLLVSDDQNGTLAQSLYALELVGGVPEPATSAIMLAGLAMISASRRARG